MSSVNFREERERETAEYALERVDTLEMSDTCLHAVSNFVKDATREGIIIHTTIKVPSNLMDATYDHAVHFLHNLFAGRQIIFA